MTGPIFPIAAPLAPEIGSPAGPRAGGGFQEMFSTAVRAVEGLGQDAAASTGRFLSGEGEEVHTTVLAVQRAELAFDLFLQARNKVVSAYQEIMRMQM
ncbi:MAG: flagellar hook-basal body complex protein FliE [Acidobacteriia bacterium]|nr:flagellar hook-basal body complex protein FliE [Terriglobia bacterium]